MKPAIANFLRHVYPDLTDHETTKNRKPVRGVKQDVFLLHHEFGETRTNETSSKMNDHEADFCLCLCRYLLQQGYTTSQITILTGYSGQVFALKSRMKKEAEFYKGMRVTAVDNYQGEENDIIILSLVRSNEEGNVGFLGTDNRVCVALSRARDGLYAIGNFKCMKKCGRPVCTEGHLCLKKCYEPCGKCTQRVEKVIPMCGHKAMIECHRDPHILLCTSRCEGNLEKCGHQCSGKCGQCRERKKSRWPVHRRDLVINHVESRWTAVTCARVHAESAWVVACTGVAEKFPKLLPGCDHVSRLPCGSKWMPCKEPKCLDIMQAQQMQSCLRRAVQTLRRTMSVEMRTQEMSVLMSQSLSTLRFQVSPKLKCGHLCSGFCGETCLCFKCEEKSFVALEIQGLLSKEECAKVDDDTLLVKLPDCKHIFRADILDAYVERKPLLPGKFLLCPACNTSLKDWHCWRYHGKLRTRRLEHERKKAALKTSTLVSSQRQHKIFKSMDMLRGTEKDPRSFAYSASRKSLESRILNVNQCFALTNQIKLAKMIEMIDQLFLKSRIVRISERDIISDLQDDVEALKKSCAAPSGQHE
ncbi:hypothetical protein C0Q70_19515 [Pomacea canaliculata]|uniref:DNA2/NAM7 helicase-like C-terminal domain-containing protein n=1 Tax=Pomacea canaliculata TaxID=400727 RepID=A0A2T7NJJ3_POMCA|nr:hypothetical protein C0Q70_19515 [Pomacea canaliculata]